ncbi:hypothetical protein CNR22_06965 [Sphingobacteriaceae bacterium]|nr:hypothetical protein CNR22_06965 [Sphingobacteriaceae bacterium]
MFVFPLALLILALEMNDGLLPVANSSVARVKVAASTNALDYLFVGPSYFYNGIYTPAFDSVFKATFVLGVATAGPYFYEVVLDDYLACCKEKPKIIVLNLNPGSCSEIFDNWQLYPIHRYLNNPLSNEFVAYKYSDFGVYTSLLRKSIEKAGKSMFHNKYQLQVDFENAKEDAILYKGFLSSSEIVNDSIISAESHSYQKFKMAEFSAVKANYFIELVKKYKKKNTEVKVLETPTFKLDDYLSENYKRQYSLFKKRMIESGIDFIPAPDDMNDYTYFSSVDHMNISGAKYYTNYLLTQLGPVN